MVSFDRRFLWLKGDDFFGQNILTQLGTIIDTFDDIRSLLELFRFSNHGLNNAKYAARHIYAVVLIYGYCA